MQFGVFGAQVAGHGGGMRALVVVGIVEADREAAHRSRRLRLHQGGDQRGIGATGEERTQRHVRLHAQADRIAQQGIERIERVLVAALEAGGDRRFHALAPMPPRLLVTGTVAGATAA